jgi:hypothetical protein
MTRLTMLAQDALSWLAGRTCRSGQKRSQHFRCPSNTVAEKLTKTAIKAELQRRIDWYERAYPKIKGLDRWNYKNESRLMVEACGHYWAYSNMLWQVENGLFSGGGL